MKLLRALPRRFVCWLAVLWLQLEVSAIEHEIAAETLRHETFPERMRVWNSHRALLLQRIMRLRGRSTGSVIWSCMGKTR